MTVPNSAAKKAAGDRPKTGLFYLPLVLTKRGD